MKDDLIEMDRKTFEQLPKDIYGLPRYFSDFDGERHFFPKELGGSKRAHYPTSSQEGKVIEGKISLKKIKSLWNSISDSPHKLK